MVHCCGLRRRCETVVVKQRKLRRMRRRFLFLKPFFGINGCGVRKPVKWRASLHNLLRKRCDQNPFGGDDRWWNTRDRFFCSFDVLGDEASALGDWINATGIERHWTSVCFTGKIARMQRFINDVCKCRSAAMLSAVPNHDRMHRALTRTLSTFFSWLSVIVCCLFEVLMCLDALCSCYIAA